jgi:hypothetical protein
MRKPEVPPLWPSPPIGFEKAVKREREREREREGGREKYACDILPMVLLLPSSVLFLASGVNVLQTDGFGLLLVVWSSSEQDGS